MRNMKYNTKDVTVAKSGYEVFTNMFCVCENGDPKKVLFYGSSLQANRDKRICEWGINKGQYKDHSAPVSIAFVAVGYMPQRNYD